MDNLEEIKIKNNIDLSPYKFECDKLICDSIPHPLPKTTFKIALIGKSGSGKTSLLRNLTEKGGKNKIYKNKFSNVFYISPSIKSMENKPKLQEDRFYKSLNELPEILDRIKNNEDHSGLTLLIMDDITNEIKESGELGNNLKQIYQNNRHLGNPILDDDDGSVLESGALSSIILSQRCNNLSRFIRSQLTHLIIFDPRSTKSELKTIFDEFMHCNIDVFNEILRRTFDNQKYNFLFIDINNSKIYRNFDTEYVIPKTYL